MTCKDKFVHCVKGITPCLGRYVSVRCLIAAYEYLSEQARQANNDLTSVLVMHIIIFTIRKRGSRKTVNARPHGQEVQAGCLEAARYAQPASRCGHGSLLPSSRFLRSR